MKRHILSLILALTLMISIGVQAYAMPRANSVSPSISFSGTTANCCVAISAIGNDIDATLELWCANRMVDSWDGSGRHSVTITGSYDATSGKTYTVKVTGTIGNNAIVCYPATADCP